MNLPRRQLAALVAAVAVAPDALPALYAWAVRCVIRRNVRRLRAGDLSPLLSTYARDVRFVFPGSSLWTTDLRGKNELKRWLERFVRVGLQLQPHEILVQGPPWNTIVCVRFTDKATSPDGTIVYDNRGVIFARVAWGKITCYELHLDTQKVAEFDEHLASCEPTSD